MPRTYIRKKIKSYSPQDLAQAIAKVKNGELTQHRAALDYKIPMTTLHDKLRKGETARPNAGRPTVIHLEDEKEIAETVRIMEKSGYGLSRFEIMELVAKYVRVNKIKTPFKNNVPGKDWFINFRKRHGLSIKKAAQLSIKKEAQLKKCWDNLKTRRKDILALEKKEKMRTGGRSCNPNLLSTSSQHEVLQDGLAEQTDVELYDVIDSDNIPIEEVQVDSWDPDTPQVLFAASESRTQKNEPASERDHNTTTPPRFSESRLTDYGEAPSQESRNIRTRVIQEEFCICQKSYDRSQNREEELHKLKIAEKEWIVKAAEENFFKAKAEREAMEELLQCHRAKREEAELHLAIFRNKN